MSNMFRCTLTGFAACAFFTMLMLVTLPGDAGAGVTLISFI